MYNVANEVAGADLICFIFFFFSSRRRHTRYWRDWSSDVCSSDLWSRPLLLPQVLVFAGVDVGVELLDRGLLALFGEPDGLVYGLLGLALYLVELLLVNVARLEELLLQQPDGVALAPLLYLFFGAVLLEEVGSPVGRGPVGERLDGVGLASLPYLLDQPLGGVDDRLEVHPVHLLVLYPVGVELGGEVGHRGGALDARAHPVLVVLYDEEARAHAVLAPQSGEVRCLVEGAVGDRAVPQVELRDVVRPLVALRVGEADAEGYVAADDPVAAHQAPLDVEEVHRAALALDYPRALAVELGHDVFGVRAQKKRVGVVAVGGYYPVTLLEGLQETGGHRFLPDVDVEVAPDLALPEASPARLLERPYNHHLAVEVHETIRARGYRALVTGLLRFPVFRVPVLCRHRRPLPTSRYNPTNDEQDSTLRRLVRKFYCRFRPDVCTVSRLLFHPASPATRGPA